MTLHLLQVKPLQQPLFPRWNQLRILLGVLQMWQYAIMENLVQDTLVDTKSVFGEEAAVHVRPLQNHPSNATIMSRNALQTNLLKSRQWSPHHHL